METCKLCNKEYKNMGAHLRQSHDMSTEDYTLMYSEDTEVTDELADMAPSDTTSEANMVISREEREARIMDTERGFNGNMTVDELCAAKEITMQELAAIIMQFKTGTPSLRQQEQQYEAIGIEGAQKLCKEANPSTTNLHVAEALCTKFGFEVTHITKGPKTWHLTKAK